MIWPCEKLFLVTSNKKRKFENNQFICLKQTRFFNSILTFFTVFVVSGRSIVAKYPLRCKSIARQWIFTSFVCPGISTYSSPWLRMSGPVTLLLTSGTRCPVLDLVSSPWFSMRVAIFSKKLSGKDISFV